MNAPSLSCRFVMDPFRVGCCQGRDRHRARPCHQASAEDYFVFARVHGTLSFRGAPPGATPESILPIVVIDSGLVLRTPRNDTSWMGQRSSPQNIPVHAAPVEMEERHRRIMAQGSAGEAVFALAQNIFVHGMQCGERVQSD